MLPLSHKGARVKTNKNSIVLTVVVSRDITGLPLFSGGESRAGAVSPGTGSGLPFCRIVKQQYPIILIDVVPP